MLFRIVSAWCTALIVLSTSCASDEEPSPTQRCEHLRDHLIERKLADASGVDRAKHAVVMRAALGDEFIHRCTNEMSERQRECALLATDAESISACSKL